MYKAGDLVIYGNHGVCRIESVGEPNISGVDKSKLYYTLSPLYHSEKIFTPVDTNIFMRPIITYEEAEQLISHIPPIDKSLNDFEDIRSLEAHYKNLLKSHSCSDLLRLIKTIYAKSRIVEKQGKKLGQIEKRFMSTAEEQLYGEFAAALNMPKENVKIYVEEKIKAQEYSYE